MNRPDTVTLRTAGRDKVGTDIEISIVNKSKIIGSIETVEVQTGNIMMEVHMKEVRLNSFIFLLLIPIISVLANSMPESWLEGPFNHDTTGDFFNDSNMVSNTLYYNNKSNYYTVWDDDTEQYVTYDKRTNTELETVVFNVPEDSGMTGRVRLINGWDNVASREVGARIVIADAKVVPTSHLDEEGMRIQAEHGCVGCHEI